MLFSLRARHRSFPAQLFLLVLVLALTSACSEPTIDASTPEMLEASIEQVRQDLPEDMRADFDTAMKVVAMGQLDLGSLFSAGANASRDEVLSQMTGVLDGKTAKEVIKMADSIRAARRAEQIQQVRSEIAELEEKRAAAKAATDKLAKFEVLRSRLRDVEQRFSLAERVIELTVRNGLDTAVSRAYFTATLASPGRAVPWLEEEFNYSIPGGVEPGETVSWQLRPPFTWPEVDAPSDAVFTVDVVQLDGPDGEMLYSTQQFMEDDMERLSTLRETLEELGSEETGS